MSTQVTKIARELGLRKVDAKGHLPILVTDLDVKKASKKNPEQCAYARACTGRIPGVKAAYFFKTTAWLRYKDKIVRYVLPPSMQKEIVAFDRNQSMEPGRYYLTPPGAKETLTALKKRNTKKPYRQETGKNRGKRKLKHATTNVRALVW